MPRTPADRPIVFTTPRPPNLRPWTAALVFVVAFSALLLAACLVGQFGRRDIFWSGAVRPMSGDAVQFERWETHIMLGLGTVALRRYPVTSTQPFDFPFADLNSRELAWATLTNGSLGRQPATKFEWSGGSGGYITLPAWIATLLVLAIGAGVIAFVAKRRRALVREWTLRCRCCGYDLRGLADSSRCPECATPTSPWARQQLAAASATAQTSRPLTVSGTV